MAVACTLLASGGFVGAGYADNSVADAAPATAATAGNVRGSGPELASRLDSLATPNAGIKIAFADTLIISRKPRPKTIFDLTNFDGKHPGAGDAADVLLGGITEFSPEFISQVRKEILAAAFEGLGHSYVWGGTSFSAGWDCSGFVQWAYAQAGIALPRTEQWASMVRTNNPQPGDIVVQNPDGPDHWSHIGIYIGGGLMISALNPAVGTIMHTPASTSSSSTYFTMREFASLDEQAALDHAGLVARENAGPPSATRPATGAGSTPGATTKPAPGPTTGSTPPAATGTPTQTPAPSRTATASPTPSARPSPTPSASSTPSASQVPTSTASPTSSPSATPSPAATPSPSPSATTTASPSPSPAPSSTTVSATPSADGPDATETAPEETTRPTG
jgi:cell wall-associated NlpC family hydrolase